MYILIMLYVQDCTGAQGPELVYRYFVIRYVQTIIQITLQMRSKIAKVFPAH